MRPILFLSGITIVSMLAYAVKSDAGAPAHSSSGHGGLAPHTKHGGGHTEQMGILHPHLSVGYWLLYPREPIPTALELPASGKIAERLEHLHQTQQSDRIIPPHFHFAVQHERAEDLNSSPTTNNTDESDETNSAAVPANPTTSSWSPIPPGAAGPGRPMTGQLGPGKPAPGRQAIPRR